VTKTLKIAVFNHPLSFDATFSLAEEWMSTQSVQPETIDSLLIYILLLTLLCNSTIG